MTIRLTWFRALATLAALFAAGMLFAWSGVFNIAASSGHWKITDWFLHWTMRNSVQTHAAFTAPDDPIDRGGLVSAAGHFAGACASCHGAPGVRPSPVMQAATPPAPNLAVNARDWTDKQIFWILQHGVKYTGMPAWGAPGRPDEIRRMVAFVRQLPTMTPAHYRALTEAAAGAATVGIAGVQNGTLAACASCHGSDGRGRGQPDIPVLGGQSPTYLYASLQAYAAGKRHSAVMANAAATLTDAEMRALAAHFAGMPGLTPPTRRPVDPRAQEIVERGLPQLQIPACTSCHRPGTRFPAIDNQRATFIADRLRAWHGEEGVVDARQTQATMPVIARRIPKDMIDPVARYLAGE